MVSPAPEPAPALPPVVLFDLDGTLIDSAPGIIDGLRHAMAAIDRPMPAEERVRELIGPPLPEILRQLGAGSGLDDPVAERDEVERGLAAYRRVYRESGWSHSRVFDGIPAALDELLGYGVRLAVATSKAEVVAERVLEHYDLRDRFGMVAGASEDGTRTLKKDVIARALGGLEVPAIVGRTTGVAMIGDRSHDIEGSRYWGIPCIAVTWGYGTETEHAAADRVVDHPADLVVALDGLVTGTVHVTFVCTGNICRSPMADRIFSTAIERAGLADRVRVTSAGTGSWHVGDPADRRARAELERHGYPSRHVARQVDDEILSADLIIALDRGHERALRGMGADPSRVRLLREFDPQARGDRSVADPYYGSVRQFAEVREQIEAAVPGLLDEVRTMVGRDR